MIRTAPWFVAIALASAILPARADGPEALAFLQRIEGEWQGAGEVRGMAADMRMRWGPALDGKFHRLAMENRMTGQDGQAWHFKAEGFYRVQEDGSITGQWFDSRGVSLPLSGHSDGDSMTIDWGVATSPERGRSTYRLVADALEVTDAVFGKDGTLAVFGRTRLARQ